MNENIAWLAIEVGLRRELLQRRKECDQLRAEGVVLREALEGIFINCDPARPWPSITAGRALSNTPLAAEQVERVKRLEAVAEAARNLVSNYAIPWPHNLRKALDALEQKEVQANECETSESGLVRD